MEEEPSQSAATECSFESIPLLPPPSLAEVRPSPGPVPSVSTGSILERGERERRGGRERGERGEREGGEGKEREGRETRERGERGRKR